MGPPSPTRRGPATRRISVRALFAGSANVMEGDAGHRRADVWSLARQRGIGYKNARAVE
jgi:hypothetical protein